MLLAVGGWSPTEFNNFVYSLFTLICCFGKALLEIELKTKTTGVLNVDIFHIKCFSLALKTCSQVCDARETTPRAKNEFIFYVGIS